MRSLNLATVCEEAACPNIGECWTKKHATVMILGDTCTRACAFCNVKTGMPRAVDPLEPEHVAIAAAKLGLEHIVVTSVDRDDLPDGGASQFVKVIEALRRETPDTIDPERRLIGDDEHGWSNNGIFNFEGGCYAKCINLQRSMEPQIWNAIKFGSVMENVILDQNREPDFGDESLTENTRVAYPIEFIPNTVLPSVGNHPDVIIFLAADAFGVFPPIGRLSRGQGYVSLHVRLH